MPMPSVKVCAFFSFSTAGNLWKEVWRQRGLRGRWLRVLYILKYFLNGCRRKRGRSCHPSSCLMAVWRKIRRRWANCHYIDRRTNILGARTCDCLDWRPPNRHHFCPGGNRNAGSPSLFVESLRNGVSKVFAPHCFVPFFVSYQKQADSIPTAPCSSASGNSPLLKAENSRSVLWRQWLRPGERCKSQACCEGRKYGGFPLPSILRSVWSVPMSCSTAGGSIRRGRLWGPKRKLP